MGNIFDEIIRYATTMFLKIRVWGEKAWVIVKGFVFAAWSNKGLIFTILFIFSLVPDSFNRYGRKDGALAIKEDIRIRKLIKEENVGFDVLITPADLLGFGERYFIVWGNKSYVRDLYGGKFCDEENGARDQNRPFVKIYVLQSGGPLFSILEKIGLHIPDFLNTKLVQLYKFAPIV